MKNILVLTVIFIIVFLDCNAQAFNSSELEKMIRMSPQQFGGYVGKKGFKYLTTTDLGGVYGISYVYVDPDKKPSNVILSPSGSLSYRPDNSGFEKLKNEIQSKYKFYSTTTLAGKQMIYYGSDTRFHLVLDDGYGRKIINVFVGLGGIK